MAYDRELADRIRLVAGGATPLTEKAMFGGLAFLSGGNMAVAASGQGGLMVRIDPAEGGRLIATTPAEAAVMRGRAMSGWLRLTAEEVADDATLREWVDRGVAYARSLPVKSAER